jgi:serine/threonine protein phosphatase PrpC
MVSRNIYGYSTISILAVYRNSKNIEFLNIGDSRIYNFTNRYLEKITEDDNVGETNNILTRFLGSDLLTIEDFKLKTLVNKGNFLICTDGFYSLMENNLIRYFKILNFKYPKRMLDTLVTEQLNINKDDSTFIILKNEI